MIRYYKIKLLMLVMLSIIVLIRTLISVDLSIDNDFSNKNAVHLICYVSQNMDKSLAEKHEYDDSVFEYDTYNLVGFVDLVAIIFLIVYFFSDFILDLRQRLRYIRAIYFSGSKYKGYSANF